MSDESMSDAELAEIEARADGTTPGPWVDYSEAFNKGCNAFHKRTGRWWNSGSARANHAITLIASRDVRGKAVEEEDFPERVDLWDLNKVFCVRLSQVKGSLIGQADGMVIPRDINFIAHSRTDIPKLIAEIRRLREKEI